MSVRPPVRAAVAGATGYIGIQCVELLARHPGVELHRLLARSHAGHRFCDVVPGSRVETTLVAGLDRGDAEVVFSALPHTVAAGQAREWVDGGAVVVDMSADFRLRDAVAWEDVYGVAHPAPELCAEAVYALPELAGADLDAARILAAPGCYPTAALLATVPALREGLVEPVVVVDAKSGVSGAGRSPSLGVHFAEVNESVHAYAVGGHRHASEMLQQMRAATRSDVGLTFVPHLVPMTRGLLATAYMPLRPGVDAGRLRDAYAGLCAGHPFLRLDAAPPSTKSVVGTNVAALHTAVQGRTAVVTCAIDNLVKGAAGQGVQAFNLRFDFDETAALPMSALWP